MIRYCSNQGWPCEFNSLCFATGVQARSNSYYGVYTKPMLLSRFYCNGRESSLLDCSFDNPTSSCDQFDIAGVSCAGNVLYVVHTNIKLMVTFLTAPCTDGVNLLEYSGSLSSTSGGVVQMCVNQTRHLICDDGWDVFSASALCQTLGYSPYGTMPHSNYHSASTVLYCVCLCLDN